MNLLTVVPMAWHHFRSSMASSRRSPRSHLLTKVCVTSSLEASSTCVIPAFSLAARSASSKRRYSSLWIDFFIAGPKSDEFASLQSKVE